MFYKCIAMNTFKCYITSKGLYLCLNLEGYHRHRMHFSTILFDAVTRLLRLLSYLGLSADDYE